MTPEQIAKESEFSHQCAIMCWAANNADKWPELAWYHSITNEEKTGSAIVGARAKVSGRKKGVVDTMLPVRRGNYAGLYIEFKKPSQKPKNKTSKGGVSDEQKEFMKFVQEQGYGAIVCYHWEEARDMLIRYLEYK